MAGPIGRPKSMENIELVTLDECLERSREFLRLEKAPFSRRTLQNKLSGGEFTRYGTYHKPQLDWNEVKRTLHWRKKIA